MQRGAPSLYRLLDRRVSKLNSSQHRGAWASASAYLSWTRRPCRAAAECEQAGGVGERAERGRTEQDQVHELLLREVRHPARLRKRVEKRVGGPVRELAMRETPSGCASAGVRGGGRGAAWTGMAVPCSAFIASHCSARCLRAARQPRILGCALSSAEVVAFCHSSARAGSRSGANSSSSFGRCSSTHSRASLSSRAPRFSRPDWFFQMPRRVFKFGVDFPAEGNLAGVVRREGEWLDSRGRPRSPRHGRPRGPRSARGSAEWREYGSRPNSPWPMNAWMRSSRTPRSTSAVHRRWRGQFASKGRKSLVSFETSFGARGRGSVPASGRRKRNGTLPLRADST